MQPAPRLTIAVAAVCLVVACGGGGGNALVPRAPTQDVAGGPAVARTPPGSAPSQPNQPGQPANATPAPAQPAAPPQSYTVVAGDTPGGIAEKLNVPSDRRAAWTQQLLSMNNTTANALQIGQVLRLPAGATSAPAPGPSLPQPNVTPAAGATPAPGAPVIVQLTSPVARDAEVTLRVRAGPSQGCSPTHFLPSGGVSGAAGLGPRLADPSGNVEWKFTIPGNTPVGEGSVRVICAGNVVAAPLVVQ